MKNNGNPEKEVSSKNPNSINFIPNPIGLKSDIISSVDMILNTDVYSTNKGKQRLKLIELYLDVYKEYYNQNDFDDMIDGLTNSTSEIISHSNSYKKEHPIGLQINLDFKTRKSSMLCMKCLAEVGNFFVDNIPINITRDIESNSIKISTLHYMSNNKVKESEFLNLESKLKAQIAEKVATTLFCTGLYSEKKSPKKPITEFSNSNIVNILKFINASKIKELFVNSNSGFKPSTDFNSYLQKNISHENLLVIKQTAKIGTKPSLDMDWTSSPTKDFNKIIQESTNNKKSKIRSFFNL